jgi:CheY-like chemotaxis protein
VLIVDDDDGIRLIARRALERLAGWEILTASTGEEAIELAARADAVLLDVMMPGMDGPATLDALRSQPSTAEIPVVMLTAKVQESDRAALQELAVSGILAKPFDPLTLHLEVADLVGWPTGG